MQSHLQPIHVVVQFLEGTGCQLLFPPGLGSSLLLCGGSTLSPCATMSQIYHLQNLPSANMELYVNPAYTGVLGTGLDLTKVLPSVGRMDLGTGSTGEGPLR